MSVARNPFRMRASERIESDSIFLGLYSPYVLETLIEKQAQADLWDNVLFIRSSPGGGKTSLLRLFSPPSLRILQGYRKHYKDIFNILKKLGVYDRNKISVLGVMFSCARNYQILEDLPVNDSQKLNLFFSLINSRIIARTIKAMLELHGVQFPEGLKQISFEAQNNTEISTNFPNKCNGNELYEFALNLEREAYSKINSFTTSDYRQKNYITDLFSLSIINPSNFKINGEKISERFILMFDDVHKLTKKQRKILISTIIESRPSISIWISERLEALDATEILPQGAYIGRDYNEINLEDYWGTNTKRFEVLLSNIADKRIRNADNVKVESFTELLQAILDEEGIRGKLEESVEELKNDLIRISSKDIKFKDWVNFGISQDFSLLEKAELLQKLEILISRYKNRTQLAFEFPLSPDEIKLADKSEVKLAAEFLLSRRFKLPYYFGMEKLVKLSFSNIEQFLGFASEFFEEISAKEIARKDIHLNAQEQERILKNVVERKWREIPKIVPFGIRVSDFITQLANIAKVETFRPSAPYAPGVTGIGIKISDYRSLFEEEPVKNKPDRITLVDVLSSCLANNLLRIDINKSQGKKGGEKWIIIYLNRWLCLKFDLPLSYGGWRPKKIKEILKWVNKK